MRALLKVWFVGLLSLLASFWVVGQIPSASGVGGSTSSTPAGAASGALTGTYPGPTIANLATGGNPGPVPYVSAAGTLGQDSSNALIIDATNHRVGVGTTTPRAPLHIENLAGGTVELVRLSYNNGSNQASYIGGYLGDNTTLVNANVFGFGTGKSYNSFSEYNGSVTTEKWRIDGGGLETVQGGTLSAGTKFTTSGCSVSATTGGAAAGEYTSGTTGTCTVTITLNGATGLTATNGWSCWANDETTPADKQGVTGSTATTVTISGTTVSGDVIDFGCVGY